MSRFIIPALRGLEPYVPGEQPQDRSYIKLNTNENPYPPSPKVLAALDRESVSSLNLYSDPTTRPLKQAIAEHYGVKLEQVFAGNGSDEVLAFAFTAYADAEHPVVIPDVSYGLYGIHAQLFRTPPRIVPVNDDFTLPVDEFIGAEGMVAFANPNAPSGIALKSAQIERILSGNPDNIVLVDEAYADFASENALPLLDKYPNLLAVRTFSKSRSLAGARIGYAIASADIIDDLERVRSSFHPYSINRLSMLAGVEAMRDEAYFAKCVKAVKDEREQSAKELKKLGFRLTPSETNFLFAAHPDISGRELYERLKARGFLVRYFCGERVKDFVRITIGTSEQMRALIGAVKEILAEVRA